MGSSGLLLAVLSYPRIMHVVGIPAPQIHRAALACRSSHVCSYPRCSRMQVLVSGCAAGSELPFTCVSSGPNRTAAGMFGRNRHCRHFACLKVLGRPAPEGKALLVPLQIVHFVSVILTVRPDMLYELYGLCLSLAPLGSECRQAWPFGSSPPSPRG